MLFNPSQYTLADFVVFETQDWLRALMNLSMIGFP